MTAEAAHKRPNHPGAAQWVPKGAPLAALAEALPSGDPRRPMMLEAAEAHLDASLPHLTTHYMGAHWLASFAVLAMDTEAANAREG